MHVLMPDFNAWDSSDKRFGRKFLTTQLLDVQVQTETEAEGSGLPGPSFVTSTYRAIKQILITQTWKTNMGPCGCTHVAPISQMKP